MKYIFFTDCVNANGYEIQDMVDKAKEVTAKTFFKNTYRENVARCFPSYYWGKGGKVNGFRMKDDLHITYYKSFFKGIPCYYVAWSGIEFIFLPETTSFIK